jgi:hypothetical protein
MAVNDFTTEATEVMIDPMTGEIIDQKDLAERLLAQAKEEGIVRCTKEPEKTASGNVNEDTF